MSSELQQVKDQKWFYEFDLPDGTRTDSYLPEVARLVHKTREKALREYLIAKRDSLTGALDISCHEGYFSLVLADYFERVTGLDKNAESLEKAKLISSLLGCSRVDFRESSVELFDEDSVADFVLCYGLLYHVENPVQIIRKLSALTNKTLCIETQVLPNDVSGSIEDGSYLWQRDLNGMFGLCVDYSQRPEGGMTDIALVPSLQAIEFLLRQFGFKTIEFYQPAADDYEQFVRRHRVILFAEK